MSTRRPRIKPLANIGAIKRKIKEENPNDDDKIKEEHQTTHKQQQPNLKVKIEKTEKNTDELISASSLINDSSPNDVIIHAPNEITQKPRQRIKATPTGGFLSPTNYVHHAPSFQQSTNHQQNPFNPFNTNLPPSRDHIPPRHRKISTVEDTQRLTTARKEFQSRYSRKSPEKTNLKICDFIFYNPSSNPMIFEDKKDILSMEDDINDMDKNQENCDSTTDDKIKEDKEIDENCLPVPQLKLGPNGEIIIDEKSLVIETTAEKQARSTLAGTKAIYLDEYNGNNGFYSRQKRTKDWSSDETVKFYRCLHTIGTDFSLMLSLFPNRSRRDLKLKFKKEERNNGALVDKALLQPNKFDVEKLKDDLENEEKIAQEKRAAEKLAQKTIKFNKNLIDETQNSYMGSKAKQTLSKGNLAYKMENSKIIKRKTVPIESNNNEVSKKVENIKVEKNLKQEDDEILVLKDNIDNSEDQLDDYRYETSSELSDSGIEITDIGNILPLEDTIPQYKNHTLAIVSKRDINNFEVVNHAIYMVCKDTGVMSKKPLDLPDDTLHCILVAMGKR